MTRIMVGWVDVYGGFWKNLLCFLRESEPRSGGRFSPWKSGHFFCKQYLAVIRQLQRLLEEFQVFFFGKVDTNPEVDSWSCPGAVRTWKSGH